MSLVGGVNMDKFTNWLDKLEDKYRFIITLIIGIIIFGMIYYVVIVMKYK